MTFEKKSAEGLTSLLARRPQSKMHGNVLKILTAVKAM